jgi:hypothetical protein
MKRIGKSQPVSDLCLAQVGAWSADCAVDAVETVRAAIAVAPHVARAAVARVGGVGAGLRARRVLRPRRGGDVPGPRPRSGDLCGAAVPQRSTVNGQEKALAGALITHRP